MINMPDKKRYYMLDGQPVEVDEQHVGGFLKANPNAIESRVFVTPEKDTVVVESNYVDGFLKAYPEATELYPAEKKNPIGSPLQTGASPSSGVPLRDVAQPTPVQKIAPSVAGGLKPPGPEMKQIIPAPMDGDMQRPTSGSQANIDSIRKAIGNAKQAADGEITQELYKINDKTVSRERMRDSLHDTDFMRDVVSGKINVNIQDDEELGQLLRSQVEAGGKTSDLWDSLKGAGYRIAAGVDEIPAMTYRGISAVLGTMIPELRVDDNEELKNFISGMESGSWDLIKKAEESEKKVFQYRENFANSLANGDFSDAGYQLLNTVSGSVPYTASAAVLSGIGGPGLAFSVLAPVGSGSELASMNISEDDAIKGLSEAEKLTRAMAFGTLEAGADVVAGRAIDRAFGLRKYLLRDAIKQTGSEMGEGAAKELAKQTAYRNVKEFGRQIGMQALEEGAAEGGTTIGQMMTDDLLGVKDYKASDYLRDVSNAAMLGAFSGAGMTAGAGAAVSAPQAGIGVKRYYDNVLSNKDGKKNIKERVDSMEESGSITKEQAESVMSSVESREKAVSAVPSDQRGNTEVIDLVQEKQDIKEQESAADDIFKPEYSKKIEELDSKIAELSGRSLEQAKEEPKQQNENAIQERRTTLAGEQPVGKEGTRSQEGAGVQQGEQRQEPPGEGKDQEEVGSSNSKDFVSKVESKELSKGDKVKLESIVSNIDHPIYGDLFKWAVNNGYTDIRVYGGRGDAEGAASHDWDQKHISININHSKFKESFRSQEFADRVMAHEIVHAIAASSLNRGKVGDEVLKEYNKELSRLRDILASQDISSLPDYEKRMIGHIMKGSPEEMLTYSLTDPKIASYFSTIIVGGERWNRVTLWDKLKNLLLGMVRSSAGVDKSLYDACVDVMNRYVGDFSPEASGNTLFSSRLDAARSIASKYMSDSGIEYTDPGTVRSVDADRAKRISDAYSEMKNDPNDPTVKAAYQALIKETLAQYDAIVKAGYVPELVNAEPYSSSVEMISSLKTGKMKVLSTESSFGDTSISDDDRAQNPLLADSGKKDVKGRKMLVNDVFRFVHDFFGHAKEGNSFGPVGEENAWMIHSSMYSPLARRAMTTETRGQNSYVNFSGVNDEAFKLRDEARKLRRQGRDVEAKELSDRAQKMMSFANQKTGLLPEEFSKLNVEITAGSSTRPTSEVFRNPVDEYNAFSGATAQEREAYKQKHKDITVREAVSVSDIIPTQSTLAEDDGKLSEGRPTLYRFNGKLYVLDGHHRIAKDTEFGKTEIDADVIDFDKAKESSAQGPGDVKSIADRIRAAKKSPKAQVSEQGFELITEAQHKRLTDRLAKAFGNKVNIVSKEEFDKAASEAGAETISDTSGTVYGAVLPDGTMYIDRSRLNANTPIHEHTHLLNQLVQKNNRPLWASIVRAVKQTKEWRDVTRDKAYSHLVGDDAIADEVFSRLVGNMGEGNWEDVIRRADNKSLYRSIRDLAKKYFDYILSSFGVDVYKDMSADSLASMALDQLLGGGNIDTAFNRVSDSLNKLFALVYGKDSILANTRFQATPVANTSDRRALEKALGERDGRAVYSAFGNVDDVQHLIAWIKKKFPIKGSAAYILNKDVTDEDGNTTNFGKGVVFKEYMASLKEDQNVKETKTSARPEDLLNQVGYSFTQTKSDDEASRQFRAYYKDGELICTIGTGGRHRRSIVTFIVRDDAKETPHARDLTQDNLTERWKEYLTQKGRKNEDGTFNLSGLSPSSRDPYSTSVVSLQIGKENGARSEISRYNHTLSSPDNIFDRNFDNVVNGLDDAMYSYFGIDKNTKQTKAKLPKNVVVDAQGNYYVYDKEENGVYWGEGYYLENGVATILDRGSQRMVDGFIINANGDIRDVTNRGFSFNYYGDVKKVNYIRGNDISITTDKGTFVFETRGGDISLLKEYDKNVLLELMRLNGIEAELNDGKYTIKNNYTAAYRAFLWNNDIVRISGYADFSDSQITTLGSLQSIGGGAYFGGSQITTLGSLQSIGGGAYFGDSQVNKKDIDRINSSSKALAAQIKEIFKEAHDKFSEAIENGDDVSFDDFLPDEYRQDKKKLQQIADALRKVKLGESGVAFSHTPLSLAWNAALEVAALSVEAAATVAEAIDAALQSFRKSDWYKEASKRSRRKEERNLREQLLGGMSMSDIRAAQKEAMSNKHYTKAPIVRVFSKIRPGDIPFSVLEDYIDALKGLSASVPNYDGLTVLMGRVVDAVEKGKVSKANAKKAKAEEMIASKASVVDAIDKIASRDLSSIKDIIKAEDDLDAIMSALDDIEYDENKRPIESSTQILENEVSQLWMKAFKEKKKIQYQGKKEIDDMADNILDIMSEVSAAGQHRRWSQPQQDLYYDLFSLLHQRGADAKAMLKKLPLSQLATLEAVVSNMMPVTVNNGANMTSSGEVDVARLSPIVDRLYSVSKDADAFIEDAEKIANKSSDDVISEFASRASAYEVQRQKDLIGMKITERSKFLDTLTQLYETGMTAYNEELRAGLDHITKAKKDLGIKNNSQRRRIGVIAIYIRDYLDGKAEQGGGMRDYWKSVMYEVKDGKVKLDDKGNPKINTENMRNMDSVKSLADMISAVWFAAGRAKSRAKATSLAIGKVVKDIESVRSSIPAELRVGGDPNGDIDPKKIWESYAANDGKALTKEERAFLESIVSYSESHLGYMQEAANEARGLPFKWIPFYVRRTVKRGSVGNVSANPNATARRGSIRLASSTGKDAKDMAATPVEYDIEKMFTHALEQTARDYHVGKTVRRANALLSRLSMSGFENASLLATSAAEYMSQMLTREFIRNVSPIDRAIGNLVKVYVMNTMANAVRTIREHAIAGTTLFLRTGRPVATVRAQIASKEKKGELLGLMHFLGSPLILKAITNKHMDMAGSEIRNPTLAEEYLRLSAASSEPMIVRSTWFPEFKYAFKKETGEDFDMSKFNNDPEYRYEYRSEMLSASTSANLAVYSIIGPALSGQRILNAQLIPFIGKSGRFSTQSPMVKQIMLFTGFSNRERQQLVNGLVGAAEGLASGDPETFARESSKTVGTAISVLAYGITGTMQFILSGYVMSALFGDDDEKEKWAKEWRDFTSGKSAFDEVIRATAGLALSKYGAVSRGMATIAASILYNSTDDKEMKEYIRKSMKDNLYSEPISMSSNKYSSEPTVVELIGEMMASARAIARIVDMGSKFVSSVSQLAEGEEEKPVEEQTLADRQGDKDAIDAVNAAYSAMVLALTVKGMPMPERATFDKIVDRLNKHPLTQKDIDDKNAIYNKMLFSEVEDSIEKEFPSQRGAGKDMPKTIGGGYRYGNDIIRKDDPKLQKIVSDAVKKYRPSSSNKIILSDYELAEDSGEMVAKNVENMRVRLNAKRLGYVGGEEGAMSEDPVAYTDLLSEGKGSKKGIDGVTESLIPSSKSWMYKEKDQTSIYSMMLGMVDAGILSESITLEDFNGAIDKRKRFIDEMEKRIAKKKKK